MSNLTYPFPKDAILFDSQNETYKNPFGAVTCDKIITFNFYTDKNLGCSKILLNIKGDVIHSLEMIRDGEKKINNIDYYIWSINFKSPTLPTLLFYHFEFFIDNTSYFYGNNYLALGGVGEIYTKNPIDYQITLYYSDNESPNWFKYGIAYQIFPDRFFNGNKNFEINSPKENSFIYGSWNDLPMYIKNSDTSIARWDFFGGNLKGIIEKANYLKSLNINTIYLNPIFEATSNHRYDTSNYLNIDPVLGTYEDFKELVKEYRKRDISIILDGVFNHTGKNSLYFKEAIKSKDSPFFSWYNFRNYPDEYESWWGFPELPCVNELEPSFFKFIIEDEYSVINHWMSIGVKGWRLDVADELPSYFIERFKYKCKELNPDSVLMGEVWEDASNKISYGQRREYFNGKQLDSVMNYPLRTYLLNFFNGSITGDILCKYMNSLKENYPKENYYSNFNLLSSHDVKRIKTSTKEIVEKFNLKPEKIDCSVNKILKSMSLIQFTLPGIPSIYYGDEVGVEGQTDPDNRRTYPWGKEDIELLSWYHKITALRSTSDVLKKGDIRFFSPHPDIFAYIRFFPNDKDFIGIITNRNPNKSKLFKLNLKEFFTELGKNIVTDIYHWNEPLIISIDSSTNFPIKIPPLETLIFSNKSV